MRHVDDAISFMQSDRRTVERMRAHVTELDEWMEEVVAAYTELGVSSDAVSALDGEIHEMHTALADVGERYRSILSGLRAMKGENT